MWDSNVHKTVFFFSVPSVVPISHVSPSSPTHSNVDWTEKISFPTRKLHNSVNFCSAMLSIRWWDRRLNRLLLSRTKCKVRLSRKLLITQLTRTCFRCATSQYWRNVFITRTPSGCAGVGDVMCFWRHVWLWVSESNWEHGFVDDGGGNAMLEFLRSRESPTRVKFPSRTKISLAWWCWKIGLGNSIYAEIHERLFTRQVSGNFGYGSRPGTRFRF